MKKKILGLLFIALLGIVAGYNTYLSQNNRVSLSKVMLDNIEALATENGSEKLYSYPCNRGYGAQCIPPNGTTGPSCSTKSYC